MVKHVSDAHHAGLTLLVEHCLIRGPRYLAICRYCPMRTKRLVMQFLAAVVGRELDPSEIASKQAQIAVTTQTLMLHCHRSDVTVSEQDLVVKSIQALLRFAATTTLLTL